MYVSMLELLDLSSLSGDVQYSDLSGYRRCPEKWSFTRPVLSKKDFPAVRPHQ